MKSFLGSRFSKNQLGDKIRRLRRAFRALHANGNPNITKTHERAKYELSKKVWGKRKLKEPMDNVVGSSGNQNHSKEAFGQMKDCIFSYMLIEQRLNADLKEAEKFDQELRELSILDAKCDLEYNSIMRDMTSHALETLQQALQISARRRSDVVQWLNGLLNDFNLPLEATDEELRAELYDGTVFGRILCKLNPESIDERRSADYNPLQQRLLNIKKFNSVLEELGLPTFRLTDLEQGHIYAVVMSLESLKDYLSVGVKTAKSPKFAMSQRSVCKLPEGNKLGPIEDDDGRWNVSEPKFHSTPESPAMLGGQSNKEGKDVRELMEQVASLEETVARKDEQIEWLLRELNLRESMQGDNQPTVLR